jgi:hypothetical protein
MNITLNKGLKKRFYLLLNLFKIALIGEPLLDVLNNILVAKLQNRNRERYKYRSLYSSSLIANNNAGYKDKGIENVLFKTIRNKTKE